MALGQKTSINYLILPISIFIVFHFLKTFVNEFNKNYEQKHLAFETQFWGTKMALSDTDDVKFNAENLSQTKKEM